MTRCMTLIACILLSPLLSMSTVAHAGTLTIYNKDCTHRKGFLKKKSVAVHVFASDKKRCTNTKVTVNKKSSKTIELIAMAGPNECRYGHEAKGTVLGAADVYGLDDHSSVTCKKDWANVCQCTKD